MSEFFRGFLFFGEDGYIWRFLKKEENFSKKRRRNSDLKQTHSAALTQRRNSFVFILFLFLFLPTPPHRQVVASSTTNTEKRATVVGRGGKVAKEIKLNCLPLISLQLFFACKTCPLTQLPARRAFPFSSLVRPLLFPLALPTLS